MTKIKCDHCDGSGYHGKRKCPVCKGTGFVQKKKSFKEKTKDLKGYEAAGALFSPDAWRA